MKGDSEEEKLQMPFPICDMSAIKVVSKIGVGADGAVYLYCYRNNCEYIAKKTSNADYLHEVAIFARLHKSGITPHIECIIPDENIIVMEKWDGNFEELINKSIRDSNFQSMLDEWLSQIAKLSFSLNFQFRIMHRDFHLGNVVYRERADGHTDFAIIDFSRSLDLSMPIPCKWTLDNVRDIYKKTGLLDNDDDDTKFELYRRMYDAQSEKEIHELVKQNTRSSPRFERVFHLIEQLKKAIQNNCDITNRPVPIDIDFKHWLQYKRVPVDYIAGRPNNIVSSRTPSIYTPFYDMQVFVRKCKTHIFYVDRKVHDAISIRVRISRDLALGMHYFYNSDWFRSVGSRKKTKFIEELEYTQNPLIFYDPTKFDAKIYSQGYYTPQNTYY
jgi:hypothetical protein